MQSIWISGSARAQVGATPEGVEVPRCLADTECLAAIAGQPDASRATLPTGADAKWRFFWRLGPRPAATAYAELNAEPVVPRGVHVAGLQGLLGNGTTGRLVTKLKRLDVLTARCVHGAFISSGSTCCGWLRQQGRHNWP